MAQNPTTAELLKNCLVYDKTTGTVLEASDIVLVSTETLGRYLDIENPETGALDALLAGDVAAATLTLQVGVPLENLISADEETVLALNPPEEG